MATLVLQNKDGEIVRMIPVLGLKSIVAAQAKDSKRLVFGGSLEELELQNGDCDLIQNVNLDELKSKPIQLGGFNRLSVKNEDAPYLADLRHDADNKKNFVISMGASILTGLIAVVGFQFAEQPQVLDQGPVVQQVIKLNPTKPKTVAKIVKRSMNVPQNTVVTSTTTKRVSSSQIKRMGALAALGNGTTSKGGLNLGAAKTTAGAGLGGTGGSGGVQSNIYGKGLVSAPLGEGGKIGGGGKFGTKGNGGGAGGYGTMSMAGSAGSVSIPLGHEAIVEGGIDKDMIATVVKRNGGQFRFCYEQSLQADPNLNGRVTLSWIINGDGSVKSVQVASTTLHSESVEACLMARLKGWKFPVPPGTQEASVSFPFVFNKKSS